MDNKPPIPANEAARLAALKSYEILDSSADERIDNLTSLASEICGVPIGLVSLIDENRQWFKSKVGLHITHTPREISFCQYAIMEETLMEVENTLNDERFKQNELVLGNPNIRFYAGQPLIDDNGFALGTLCLLHDKPKSLNDFQKRALKILAKEIVTEIQDNKLRKERAIYKTFFEQAFDLMCIASVEGFFKVVNPSFTRLLGWKKAELLAKPFIDFVHPEDVENTLNEVKKLNQGIDTIGFQNRYAKKGGGYLWLHWTSNPDKITGELYATAHDVTELKELLAKLERNNIALDEFAFTVSHDLKAPLRAISGFADILKVDLKDKLDDSTIQYFDLMINRTEKMNTLINGILRYSKESKAVGQEEMFSSFDCLHEIKEDFSHLKNFDIEISDKCPKLKFNKIQFFQLFQNLIDNGIRHNKKAKGQIVIEYESTNDYHYFKITDNGPGIKQIQQNRIFNIFHKLNQEDTDKGSGIGLAIVKKIIESNNGQISIQSDGKNGSTFLVTLPKM
jgi:PAS domain S-box-containing protein